MTAIDWLETLKTKKELKSDYALAKLLGVHQSTITMQRKGGRALSDEVALKIAEELEIPAGKILADMGAERAQSEEVRKAWEDISNLYYVKCKGRRLKQEIVDYYRLLQTKINIERKSPLYEGVLDVS